MASKSDFSPETKPTFPSYAAIPESFSNEECDRIVAFGNALREAEGRLGGDLINEEVRDSTVAFLDHGEETDWIYRRIFSLGDRINQETWRFDLAGSSRVQFSTYGPDQHYDWHVDLGANAPQSCRKISISVQLTDPSAYDGGELELSWNRDSKTGSMARGALIAFPSFVLHRVTPVTRGVRHSLVTWILGERAFR